MHVYIYDAFLQDKKYESRVAKIETRVTDLGLNGKIIRLGAMKSVSTAIEDEIKKGAKTIIAVGDDLILSQAVNAIAQFYRRHPGQTPVPLGFIPVGKRAEKLGAFLGYRLDEGACDTISARRIESFDLGEINQNYFLFHISLPAEDTSIEIDAEYSIESTDRGEVLVVNLPYGIDLPKECQSNFQDGKLELFIRTGGKASFLPLRPGNNSQSVFTFQSLRLINPNKNITIDNAQEIPAPADIKVAPTRLNLIVGKSRGF